MSTNNFEPEYADPAVLEKIDSRRAPGELTPVPNASPALSIDGRLDDSKLENGSPVSAGRPAITHRPTGLKVLLSLLPL